MNSQVALADIPGHVDPSRVFDFDFAYDAILKPDPHLGLIELSRKAPDLFFTPRYGGHWVARSHDTIYDITHDYDAFSSYFSQGVGRRQLPIMADPPEHQDYRRVLMQAFSPKHVNSMIPTISSMAIDLIDKVADRGRCEFVADVAEPMPVMVFMTMLGLPVEMMAPLRKLVIASLEEGDLDRREAIYSEQLEMVGKVIDERIRERRSDVISHIIDADIGGRTPNREEIEGYLLLLMNAGLDTVVNAMSFSIMHLARDQELQAKVRLNPKLIPDLVEEFLRRYSVSSIVRVMTRDLDYRGVTLRAGERVHLLIPAANLDETIFPDPTMIELRRDKPAVTFGTGIHRCLGSHLARLELRFVINEFFERIPTFRIDPERTPEVHAGMVYTVDKLPLTWGAGDGL